ncbi:hypothetical protein CMEL01_06328, partial [Colletotrichum melonis]
CHHNVRKQQTHVNPTPPARRSSLSLWPNIALGGILHAVGSNRRLACDMPLVAALSRGTLWAGAVGGCGSTCRLHLRFSLVEKIFRDPQYPYAISTTAVLLYPSASSLCHGPLCEPCSLLAGVRSSCFSFYPSSLALVSLPFSFCSLTRQIPSDNVMNARTRKCGPNSCGGQANLVMENPGTHNCEQRTLSSVGTAVAGLKGEEPVAVRFN